MSSRGLPVLVAVLLAGAPLACGGSVFSPASSDQDSGSHDAATVDSPLNDGAGPDEGIDSAGHDGGGGDASPPWSPECPADVPGAGSACSHDTLQCEYGSAWWSIACDVVMQCQGSQWVKYSPSFEQCSAQPGPNPSQCPATFADVPQGACTPAGLKCEYPQGECDCQVPLGGPVQLDGGSAYWGCLPGQGCPVPRPRVGTACTNEGTYCTYEACSFGEACMGGVWQGEQEACAGAQGGGP